MKTRAKEGCPLHQKHDADRHLHQDQNQEKKSLSVSDVLCFATIQAMLCSLQVYLLAA